MTNQYEAERTRSSVDLTGRGQRFAVQDSHVRHDKG